MRALLIIDVQNDFCPGGALAVPEGDSIIPVINRLQEKFQLIVATQDWHPANHLSFASNHKGKKPGDKVQLEGLEQILWPDHCVQNTPGADFAPRLDMRRVKEIFKKGTDPRIDSYSAFFDNARRKSTGLDQYLKEKDVTEVYLTGLATDYCVKYSALDALRSGFKTFVCEDAVRGIELRNGDIENSLREMEKTGAVRVRSTEV